jgi:hypothetical protein
MPAPLLGIIESSMRIFRKPGKKINPAIKLGHRLLGIAGLERITALEMRDLLICICIKSI